MKKIKNTIFGAALFYLTLYLPVALMTYFPLWYSINCKLHSRCNAIGTSNARAYIDQLTDFFLHLNPLSAGWTIKERLHLAEVRDMLDVLALFAVICIALLIVTFNRTKISTYALVNLAVILSLLLVLPFFKTFWTKVFHPLLFSNDLWKNNFMDRSFYIMPRVFFKYSIICLVAVSALINGLTWFFFRTRNAAHAPE